MHCLPPADARGKVVLVSVGALEEPEAETVARFREGRAVRILRDTRSAGALG